MKNKLALAITSSAVLGALLSGGTAFADTAGMHGGWGGRMGRTPGVFGTVSAVNGTKLTVLSKAFARGPAQNQTQAPAQTTYTVDASSATVTKDGAASTVASIATGDTVMVQGTVSGANVAATVIRDGLKKGGRPEQSEQPQGTPMMQGNGQPVIGGSVTAINGSSLTITNQAGTYTIDASNAKITKAGAASTAGNIAVGDKVLVQGSVNGTSVAATSVIDQGSTSVAAENAAGQTNTERPRQAGFFGALGGFFHNLFGFF